MGARMSSYWSDMTREHGFETLKVEGRLPAELDGTLYRTGPALTQRFGKPYGHVFEGDGAVSAFRIGGGRVEGAHRLLRSAGYVEEERAGRALYQTAIPWHRQVANNLRGRFKNTGNTAVLEWHGELYALMENAKPTAFDRELQTIGESSFGGVIEGAFSAHPHAVAARRTTYNHGLRYGRTTTLDVYALPWDGGARRLVEVPLDHPVMLHDFMATRDHLVFLVSPMQLVIWRAALSLGGFSELFHWNPEAGTEVIVVPIDEPTKVRRFRVDPFFQIHFAAGFDEPDAIAVDIMAYPDSSALAKNVADIDSPPACGEVTRVRVSHGSDEIEKERLCDIPLEFGQTDRRVAGERHRHLYGLSVNESFRFAVAHVDLERGLEDVFWYPEGEYSSEMLFAPRSPDAEEGDGFLLGLSYEKASHTSRLVVFDAQHVADGPIAQARLDHHIPADFHGVWVANDASRR
jgi:all-trans-8'-apo-beta-carotenal 15,15'-oxygenase